MVGPSRASRTHSVDLNIREGGRYRITMQPPDGEKFHLRGEYSQIDPPQHLVYTFGGRTRIPTTRRQS